MNYNLKIYLLLLMMLPVFFVTTSAQVFYAADTIVLNLPDGSTVNLMKAARPTTEAPVYYYLPLQLRLSTLENGQPEFLFMAWQGDDAQYNVILHWLLTWGLTPEQEKMTDSLLRTRIGNARLGGPVTGRVPKAYRISSESTEKADMLRAAITSGGNIPSVGGGKSATAFRFKHPNAKTLMDTAKDYGYWKNVWIEMPMEYDTRSGFQTQPQTFLLRVSVADIFKQAAQCSACFKGI